MLNHYTHTSEDYANRVLDAFNGSAAFSLPIDPEEATEENSEEDQDMP